MNKLSIESTQSLEKYFAKHVLWENPLLQAMRNHQLDFSDYQYIFGQYYFYSINFTKLIAAGMMKIPDHHLRASLIYNLWEECGETDQNKQHAKLFQEFLTAHLKINLPSETRIENFTKQFIDGINYYCQYHEPLAVIAFLAYGVEGMVPTLYQYFVDGLRSIGMDDNALKFFLLHMVCDDAHAETLKAIVLHYLNNDFDIMVCKTGANMAYQLRDDFFHALFNELQIRKQREKIDKIFVKKNGVLQKPSKQFLYENNNCQQNINFAVTRILTDSTVLDSRLLTINAGAQTERHAHAHESIFYVIDGEGEVSIDNYKITIGAGDIVYIPRWSQHMTRNTTQAKLQILAITDFYLTQQLLDQSESNYRVSKVYLLS